MTAVIFHTSHSKAIGGCFFLYFVLCYVWGMPCILLFLLLCMPRLASAFGGSRKEKGDIKVSLYICIYVYMI